MASGHLHVCNGWSQYREIFGSAALPIITPPHLSTLHSLPVFLRIFPVSSFSAFEELFVVFVDPDLMNPSSASC